MRRNESGSPEGESRWRLHGTDKDHGREYLRPGSPKNQVCCVLERQFRLAIWIVNILFFAFGVACLWLPRGRKVVGDEPRCAGCGYIVHGLPEPTCPECGNDLSRPNAVVRSRRLPPGRVSRSIGWSLFCLFAVAMPLWIGWQTIAVRRLPQMYDGSRIVTFSYPASQAYQSIRLAATSRQHVYANDPEPPPNDIKLQVTLQNQQMRELAVDPPTLHYRDTASPQSQWSASPLDADALVAWLKRAGVQAPAEALQIEAHLVMIQLHQVLDPWAPMRVSAGAGFNGISATSGGSRGPLPWINLPPMAAAALLWAIGLLWIFARRG